MFAVRHASQRNALIASCIPKGSPASCAGCERPVAVGPAHCITRYATFSSLLHPIPQCSEL
ncbi:hypothetical protein OF83DRAFT_1134817 [Amylostereum chailletii]|nr:hypothetical protein OF83DRAFT_1134817 [Amylostereum chailletii]